MTTQPLWMQRIQAKKKLSRVDNNQVDAIDAIVLYAANQPEQKCYFNCGVAMVRTVEELKTVWCLY